MRGLLTRAAIDRLIVSNDEDFSENDRLLHPLINQFSSRVTRAAQNMVPVYTTYFCFENAVRELVASVMTDAYGEEWFKKVPLRIQTLVNGRKRELAKNKWFTYSPVSDVSQLLFGDLSSIITDQWKLFEDLFPNQDWVRTRLTELEMSRNIIAHANELPAEEIDRITRYLSDWLKQIPS